MGEEVVFVSRSEDFTLITRMGINSLDVAESHNDTWPDLRLQQGKNIKNIRSRVRHTPGILNSKHHTTNLDKLQLIMSLLSQMFALPSVEKRRAPAWFLRSLVGRKAARAPSDDTYIYYLIFRASLFVSLSFALLNAASRILGMTFDFYFFVIDLTGSDYVKTFLLTYTRYIPTILLFLILPYYVVFFRLHINPRTFDLCRWSEVRPRIETMTKRQVRALWLPFFLIQMVAMYGSFGLFMIFLDALHLGNSYSYFLFCAVALSFLLALFNYVSLSLIMQFWRYSSEHVGE